MASPPIGNFKFKRGADSPDAILDRLAATEESRDVQPEARKHKLDGEAYERLWKKLRGWLEHEKQLQLENRIQQAIDADFYDGIQWRIEDALTLEQRGQAPLVYNIISLSINWLIGTELRMRKDWRVRPRERDDEPLAPVKTKALKYLSDANSAPAARSRAAAEMLKVGIGWLDHGVNTDPTKPAVRIGYESWRNCWRDSYAKEVDRSDARYVFRERDTDEDIAQAMFPDRKDIIAAEDDAADIGDEFDEDPINQFNRYGQHNYLPESRLRGGGLTTGVADGRAIGIEPRRRVRLTECWYRVPVFKQILRGEVLNGVAYDKDNALHARAIKEGVCSLVGNLSMEVRYAIWCSRGLLAEGKSPYRHNRFPLVEMVCYTRDRDGQPYGVIRQLRDAQEAFNKRSSKALHLLSTRRVTFDQGAFDDEDEAREEFAAADTFVAKRKGYEVKVEENIQLAQAHLELQNRDAQHIETGSGVTNELVAIQSEAVSGVAIEKRQQQGQLTTTQPFENERAAMQQSGEISLSLMEQYVTEPLQFRVAGAKPEQNDFIGINQPSYDEASGEWQYMNDITKRQADFVMDEQDWRESVRVAQAESLMGLMAKWPAEVVIKFFPQILELLDLPNKEEMLKIARQIAGQPPPEEQLSPAEKAERDRQAEMQHRAEALMLAQAEGEVQKLLADVRKTMAEGEKIDAQAVAERMKAINDALQAALTVASAPQITPAADQLLDGAGMPQFVPPGNGASGAPILPAAGVPSGVQ